MPKTWSRAAGLRAIEVTSAAKTLPMPTPTPASAIAGEAGADHLGGGRVHGRRPFRKRLGLEGCRGVGGGSVQMDRVAADRGRSGSRIRRPAGRRSATSSAIRNTLNASGRKPNRPRRDGKAGEDGEHRVAGHHVGEQPDRLRLNGRDQIGDDLDRHEQRRHHDRRARREEKRKEMEAVPDKADERHSRRTRTPPARR